MSSALTDPARLAAVRSAVELVAEGGGELDRIARLAARIASAPVALVSLLEEERQYFAAAVGLPPEMATLRETPLSHSICRFEVTTGEPLVVDDARTDERTRANGAVRDLGVAAYAGVPIRDESGLVLGSLCAIDVQPRRWDAGITDALAELAALVGAELGARRAAVARADAERSLRRSEELAAALLAASPDCVVLLDRDGRIISLNDQGWALVEVDDPRPFEGLEWIMVWPEEERARIRAALDEARSGRASRLEGFAPTAKGTPKWWDVVIAPLRAEGGEVARLLAVSREITGIRQAAERLAEAQSVGRIGSWELDLATGRSRWSPQLFRLCGLEPLERTLSEDEVFATVHPDDVERVRGTTLVSVAEERAFEHEYRTVWPDGTVRTLHVRSELRLGVDGAVRGIVGTAQDVTERAAAERARRESEERFRALIEHSSELITLLDVHGTILFTNPSWSRVLGYPSTATQGMHAFGLVHPDDLAAVSERFLGLLAEPLATVRAEYRIRDAAGAWHHVQTTAQNRLDDPAIRAIVLNSRDVTEERALAAQLRHAQKMEAVGRLAGGVAHDFNNLLQVIVTSSAFAREAVAPGSSAAEDLDALDAAAARAADLTRQLLAFSRQQVMRPAVLDLNVLVGNMERMLRRVIAADLTLVSELDPALATVHADQGQLEQVLMNLVVNARDAIGAGGTIRIVTRNALVTRREATRDGVIEPGRWVAVDISDTGAGMDAETRARIFEPFFTTKERGTGLGLATVYGIVQQSGGHILVESAPGAGATFTVLLPAHEAERVADARVATTDGAAGGRETVLLVEDEGAVRTTVRRMLERAGYRVIEAQHGRDALELLARHAQVDLLLTDVVMPELAASGLLAEVRRLRPTLRALVMSGYSAEAVARQGALAPGVELLGKPFSMDDLLRRVRAVLDGA